MDKERSRLEKKLAEVPRLDGTEQKHKSEQRKVALSGDSGIYIPHVYRVFNDPDFQQEVLALRQKLESSYYDNISLTTGNTDEHLLLEDKELLKDLADKYCITLEDLGLYADGYFEAGYDFGQRMSEYGGLKLNLLSDTHTLCYVIGQKTTLDQIIADWPYIKGMRAEFLAKAKENTKNKSPNYPDLIYAIFKARAKDKLKFSEIFALYQKGKLKDYSGKNTTLFKSEDSLERYYRKYMPEKQTNDIITVNH